MRDEVDVLLSYLQRGRDVLLWKLEGLSEYDIRRPLTPTGTNLLGLVKHMAGVEHEYLYTCLGRQAVVATPWVFDEAEDNSDMWATAAESRSYLTDTYRQVWAADDAIVRELGLDAAGQVPWWGERGAEVSIRDLLVHLIAETGRHAGHADILRESIDGAAGLLDGVSNLPERGADWWASYVAQLELTARTVSEAQASE